MNVWHTLAIIWGAAVLMMTLGWQWQRRTNNAGIVDVLWSSGLGAAAIVLALLGDGAKLPRVLLAVLGGVWSARLAIHLWQRVSSESEDGRYKYLREHWHGSQLKFFGFFQLQALLIPLFALPFAAVAVNPEPTVTVWTALAVVLWVISVAGEYVADRQLAHFKEDPANKGKTCRAGLWRYSRHPNYFFEWVHWLTYVVLAVASPLIGLSVVGPVSMYVFLRWLSGVPFTESQALRSRGEDYRMYQRQTSMFFPWFPRRAP